jgi:hypothetical protein
MLVDVIEDIAAQKQRSAIHYLSNALDFTPFLEERKEKKEQKKEARERQFLLEKLDAEPEKKSLEKLPEEAGAFCCFVFVFFLFFFFFVCVFYSFCRIREKDSSAKRQSARPALSLAQPKHELVFSSEDGGFESEYYPEKAWWKVKVAPRPFHSQLLLLVLFIYTYLCSCPFIDDFVLYLFAE